MKIFIFNIFWKTIFYIWKSFEVEIEHDSFILVIFFFELVDFLLNCDFILGLKLKIVAQLLWKFRLCGMLITQVNHRLYTTHIIYDGRVNN